jgi:hypothetical protein
LSRPTARGCPAEERRTHLVKRAVSLIEAASVREPRRGERLWGRSPPEPRTRSSPWSMPLLCVVPFAPGFCRNADTGTEHSPAGRTRPSLSETNAHLHCPLRGAKRSFKSASDTIQQTLPRATAFKLHPSVDCYAVGARMCGTGAGWFLVWAQQAMILWHKGPREVHDIASGHPGLYLCGIGERQARDVGPRAPMELAHQKIIGAKRVEALLYHCSKIFALRSMSRRSESRWMPFEPCRGARRQSGSPCE